MHIYSDNCDCKKCVEARKLEEYCNKEFNSEISLETEEYLDCLANQLTKSNNTLKKDIEIALEEFLALSKPDRVTTEQLLALIQEFIHINFPKDDA